MSPPLHTQRKPEVEAKRDKHIAGELTQWLRELVALEDDLGSVLSTHIIVHIHS